MTENTAPGAPDERAGILFAAIAYAVWGVMPLYWRLLGDVPPVELTVHRVLWCAIFLMIVVAWRSPAC
jgi:chloramphenicol-sensitive protein RarD